MPHHHHHGKDKKEIQTKKANEQTQIEAMIGTRRCQRRQPDLSKRNTGGDNFEAKQQRRAHGCVCMCVCGRERERSEDVERNTYVMICQLLGG